MKKHILSTMFLTGGMLLYATPALAVEIIDIGPVSGSSDGVDVNSLGQVTGFMQATGGSSELFFWDPGTGLQPLGTFGYDSVYIGGFNDQGRIVGRVQENMTVYPYLWDPVDGFQLMGSGTGGASGINNHGRVVGSSTEVEGGAFLWSFENGMQPLDLSAGGAPRDISDTDYVTGNAAGPGFGTQPFLWKGGVTQYLGYLESDYTVANAVNDFGAVVGYGIHWDGTSPGAFLWDAEDGMRELLIPDTYSSRANDISNTGQIVGTMTLLPSYQTAAFLYQDGVAIDLNSLLPEETDWILGEATAINESGQIVGSGFYQGEGRAFLMTIPSPGSAVLLPILLLRLRRRRY